MTDTVTNPENVTASAGRGDAITATASPRPWRVEGPFPGQRETKRQHGFRDYANVLDANGFYIAQNLPPETAALIVDAVNYYKPDLHCDWRELTPEEAVAHCREVAARLGDTPCARDHLQLAAWIEERDSLCEKWRESARKLVESEADLYNETKRRVAAEAERDRLAADEARYRTDNVRLRDIVRRLCDELDSHYYETESMDDPCIIREARAAIGEDEACKN